MPYFSRLTDIVTCNLTQLLADAPDPAAVLAEIVREMQEGIAGAQRCMRSAGENESRLRGEIDAQRQQSQQWVSEAKTSLVAGREEDARLALMRKHEVENLIAGLEMQLKAASATREHLTTTYHALEARLADAERRLASLHAGGGTAAADPTPAGGRGGRAKAPARATDLIDVELEAMKRELDSGGCAPQ